MTMMTTNSSGPASAANVVGKFGELTGTTPSDFREKAVAERKAAFR